MINVDNIQTWTILIVDDEPDNLNVARKILAYNGAQILTAANGEEGLALMADAPLTFVLLDLSMPKMDGWEMYQRVRADGKLKATPIIALTAHAMEEDRKRALDMGFDGYITKPFRIDTLLDDIREALRRLNERPSAHPTAQGDGA